MTTICFKMAFLLATLTVSAFADDQSAPNTAGQYHFKNRSYQLMPYPTNYKAPDSADSLLTFNGWDTSNESTQVDLKDQQSEVKDQGQRGSCAYFGALAVVESAFKKFNNNKVDPNFSEEYLIYYTKTVLGQRNNNEASSLSNNLFAIKSSGLMWEEDMPYQISWFESGMPCWDMDADKTKDLSCFSHDGPQADRMQNRIKPSAFDLHIGQFDGNQGQIIKYLNNGNPVTVSIPLNHEGWNDKTGVVTHNSLLEGQCRVDPDNCGGHIVLLVGYNLTKRVYKFKNSWGADWGQGGYGEMSFDYVNKYGVSTGFYTATVNRADFELKNSVIPTAKIENVNINIQENILKFGERGVFLKLEYNYLGLIGSYHSINVFPMTKNADGTYDKVQDPDRPSSPDQKVYVETYRVTRTAKDQFVGGDSAIEVYIPYRKLRGLKGSGKSVVIRTSIEQMTDTKNNIPLDRTYTPITIE